MTTDEMCRLIDAFCDYPEAQQMIDKLRTLEAEKVKLGVQVDEFVAVGNILSRENRQLKAERELLLDVLRAERDKINADNYNCWQSADRAFRTAVDACSHIEIGEDK